MTYAALLPVIFGIVLASRFEPSFHLMGFAACLGATVARVLKRALRLARDGRTSAPAWRSPWPPSPSPNPEPEPRTRSASPNPIPYLRLA